jgi:chitin disaccharide deacetylase
MDLSPGQKYVIVNADDFGFSPLVSLGIIRAHKEGIVTSTTIAANMPAAGDAVGLLADLPALGMGVHLNCTQGPALSGLGRQMLAGDNGLMNFSAAGIIKACLLRPRLIGAIHAEFEAQIQWALDNGIKPTHLDSHRHSHVFLPLFRRVVSLARRYHIRFIRRCRENLPVPAGLRVRPSSGASGGC